MTSRFEGRDYKGGKGKTTSHGTHVPLVVSWPAAMQDPVGVCSDLISSTDFLPTICAAAGIEPPDNVDGVSFLPQLRGEAGTPRQWLYTWYSPRLKMDLAVKEYAFDKDFKLYRTGQFYDLQADPAEEHDLAHTTLADQALAARAKLRGVLDRFVDVRPVELDQQFSELWPATAAPD